MPDRHLSNDDVEGIIARVREELARGVIHDGAGAPGPERGLLAAGNHIVDLAETPQGNQRAGGRTPSRRGEARITLPA